MDIRRFLRITPDFILPHSLQVCFLGHSSSPLFFIIDENGLGSSVCSWKTPAFLLAQKYIPSNSLQDWFGVCGHTTDLEDCCNIATLLFVQLTIPSIVNI